MKRTLAIILFLISTQMNLSSQNISVYNPFEGEIDPITFDSRGGEYDTNTVKIIAVVSGESQGGWSGHKLYTQQIISIRSWKLATDKEYTRKKLIVFRAIEKSHDFFNDIPKFSLMEIELFLNEKRTRGVMVSGSLITELSPEYKTEQLYVKNHKRLLVSGLGEFEFNHDLQNFKKFTKWGTEEIELSIDVENEDLITDELETLDSLFSNLEVYNLKIEQYAMDHILKLKNEDWLISGEKPMTKELFKDSSKLESIRIFKNGGFEFGFIEAQDIFNGGYYMISGNINEGPIHYDIGF